jgi:hypothetical protein
MFTVNSEPSQTPTLERAIRKEIYSKRVRILGRKTAYWREFLFR